MAEAHKQPSNTKDLPKPNHIPAADVNLDVTQNSDGTYQYPFYHYTYFFNYNDSKCDITEDKLKELSNKINDNKEIKKTSLIVIGYDKNILSNNNDYFIKTLKLDVNKIFTYSTGINIANFNRDLHRIGLWNNGINCLIEIVCNDDSFIDFSENNFIKKTNKIGTELYNQERWFENKLTLKFDPSTPP